jgi:hypothetical protein
MKIIRFKACLLHLALLLGYLGYRHNQVPTAETAEFQIIIIMMLLHHFLFENGTSTRSASGQPGAEYWQNRLIIS